MADYDRVLHEVYDDDSIAHPLDEAMRRLPGHSRKAMGVRASQLGLSAARWKRRLAQALPVCGGAKREQCPDCDHVFTVNAKALAD